MSTRVSKERASSHDVDESSVFRLLLEEHHGALSGARAVLSRMRESEGVRDIEGLSQLERLFSLVKDSASYLGLTLLHDVVVEAERVVDRLQLPGTKHSREVTLTLQEALEFVAASLVYARTNQRAAGHEQRGAAVLAALSVCTLTPSSMLPAELSDQELFSEDARRHVELCREAIVRASDDVEQRKEAIHDAFRAMHTLKGNAAMMGYAELEALGRAAEHVLEGLRAGELTLTADLTIALLNLLDKAGLAVGRPTAFHWSREAKALDVASAEGRIVARRTRIGSLLVEHNFVSREQVELVLAIKREPLGEALILLNALSDQQLHQALDMQRKLRAGEDLPATPVGTPVESSLHIDPHKLKQLKRSMEHMRRAAFDAEPAVQRAARELEEAVGTLDYVPLERTFRHAALLIRDLAAKQNKRVLLTMHGEQLEVDRTIIAAISDALVHLGRNAVDHGLEYEIERVTSGKAETARISLLARVEQDGLLIEVIDDGRGLRREAILSKAVALSLVDIVEAHRLSDEQVFALAFAPGFTTASRLTDISGRGVGMDVVKHSIEALGGRINISSSAGHGTRIALSLPRHKAHAKRPFQPSEAVDLLPRNEDWLSQERE